MIADEPPTPASKSSAPIHCRAIHQTHAKSTNAKHRDQLATSSKGTHHAHHTGTTLRNTASRGTARNRATQHFPRTATAAASAAKGRASAALPQFHPARRRARHLAVRQHDAALRHVDVGAGRDRLSHRIRIHPRHIVRADDPRRPVRRRVGRPDEPPHAHGHPRRGIRRDGRARARLVLRRRIQHHRRGRNAGGAIAARYLRDADRRIRAAADAAPIRGCDAEHQRRDSQSGAAGQRTDTQLPRRRRVLVLRHPADDGRLRGGIRRRGGHRMLHPAWYARTRREDADATRRSQGRSAVPDPGKNRTC